MWYYEQNGQSFGPVNADVLATLVSSGVVQPQTQVCREGETEWQLAHETELASLFSKTALSWVKTPPPDEPLPGQAPAERMPAYNRSRRNMLPYHLSALTTSLKILLAIGAIFAFVAIMSNWSEYDLITDLNNGSFHSDEAAAQAVIGNDARQQMVAMVQFLLFLATGTVFMIWIFQACTNAKSLTERPMKFTPSWAVGWYFIPIAHLYKPYEAMKEIFEISTTSRFRRTQSTAIVGTWWMLWILSWASRSVAARFYDRINDIESVRFASMTAMISYGFTIFLAIVAIMLIGQILDGQKSLSKQTPRFQSQPVAQFPQQIQS